MDRSKVPEDDDDLDQLNEVLSSSADDARETMANTLDNEKVSKKEAVAPHREQL